jgi:transforming growth factor-beta-induced protein
MTHRVRSLIQLFAVLALVLGLLPAQAVLAQSLTDKMDIVETATEAGDFTTLLAAVEAAGLVEALQGEGPLTVFAPTDEAFAALPAGTFDSLVADPAALESVLLYHVVPGRVVGALIADGKEMATLEGSNVTFGFVDGQKTVNGANLSGRGILASNGVIHVIDQVLLPPSMTGEAPAAEEAAADTAEGEATEEATAAESTEAAAAEEAPSADIVDTAVAAGDFNTLVAAVQAAGLVDALKGEGPFTVFAPTDEAFAAVPAETMDALLADPTGDLTQILLYHVVPEAVFSTDLQEGTVFVPTMQGNSVKIEVKDGTVTVNGANVVAADVMASNGVIHVIDAVILPPADEAGSASTESAATDAAAESAPAESDVAPDELPATGGESATPFTAAVVGLAVVALFGAAFVARRRMA